MAAATCHHRGCARHRAMCKPCPMNRLRISRASMPPSKQRVAARHGGGEQRCHSQLHVKAPQQPGTALSPSSSTAVTTTATWMAPTGGRQQAPEGALRALKWTLTATQDESQKSEHDILRAMAVRSQWTRRRRAARPRRQRAPARHAIGPAERQRSDHVRRLGSICAAPELRLHSSTCRARSAAGKKSRHSGAEEGIIDIGARESGSHAGAPVMMAALGNSTTADRLRRGASSESARCRQYVTSKLKFELGLSLGIPPKTDSP